MKKYLTVFVLVAVVMTSAFAADFTKPFNATAPAFATRSNRSEYGLFVNPASLRGGKFQLLMGADAQVFQAAEILSDLDTENLGLGTVLSSYLSNLPMGDFKMVTGQGSFFLGLGNFALGVFANADVDATLKQKVEAQPSVDGGVVFGFATRAINKKVTLDVGLSFHADASFIHNFSIGLDSLDSEDGVDFEKIIQDGTPMLGFSVDGGVNVGFLKDHIVASVAVTDFAPFGCWTFDINENKFTAADETEYAVKQYKNGMKLNLGVSGNAKFFGFNAEAFADVVDILNVDFASSTDNSLISHLNIGATLDFAGFIKASAALYGGDPEVGIGLDVFGNEIDVIYKISEGSSEIGQKTTDSLSVRVRCGLDTN